MKPIPARQARQAHRRRKAFARALHQVRKLRGLLSLHRSTKVPFQVRIPKMLRKHVRRLRAELTA